MKVGFEAISIFGHSGIETYTRSLISALAKLDDDIDLKLLTSFGRADRVQNKFNNDENIDVVSYFPHPYMLGYIFSPFIRYYKDLFLYKKASKKVDLFHWTNPCYYLDVMDNSVVTVHDIFPFYQSKWTFKVYEEKFKNRFIDAFKTARVLITPTNQVKQDIIENFNYVNPDKIFVTYEAADERFRQIKPDSTILNKYGLSRDTNFFLFVSRIDPRKNLQGIIEAFAGLPEHIKNDFKIVVLGSGGKNNIIELHNKVMENKIRNEFIHIEGMPDEDLIHFYNAAYCLVFPTYAEGFGLPVIEAMQCGCPVITSNISCIPEIAEDAAILINPYNTDEIREAMLKIAEDIELRKDLISRGLKQASKFSWERTARETYKAYKWAMENK